eukprot:TRINITY_DN6657_c0_g1_i18.p1 TRINITY_DN6657_c0_g1~~TRINITY_DN6657_c0_g1_i18.p1  ORF type:complete len:142 (+),score=25.71 TRINITY_DN6657_c0_g1_i18:174-599(+)
MLRLIGSMRVVKSFLFFPVRHNFETTDMYLASVEKYLQALRDQLDKYSEDLIEDVTYAAGVLTINFANGHQYIINRQTPTRQIWLVSPLSGPYRYDYDEKKQQWESNGVDMLEKLNQEFESIRKSIAVSYTHLTLPTICSV